MYIDLTTALASIKTMSELTALVMKSKVDEAVKQKAIELQSQILALQSTIFGIQSKNQELLDEKSQLEQKLVKMKNWKAQAQKYTLIEIASGVFAYAIKESEQGSQPMHWICAHCYENQQKSILQRGKAEYTGTIYSCPNCKTEIIDHGNSKPYPQPAAGGSRINYEVK
jgi:hypothetical protein